MRMFYVEKHRRGPIKAGKREHRHTVLSDWPKVAMMLSHMKQSSKKVGHPSPHCDRALGASRAHPIDAAEAHQQHTFAYCHDGVLEQTVVLGA